MADSATHMALLSRVSVGMWSAKNDQKSLYFLVHKLRSLFVFIVEDEEDGSERRPKRRFRPTATTLLRQLGAQSPFSSVFHTDGGCAFAFEVSFDDVSGMNYDNPLLRDGRLVLEANNVRKREFQSLEDAFVWYGGADGEATRATLEELFGPGSPSKAPELSPWNANPSSGAAATTACAAAPTERTPSSPLPSVPTLSIFNGASTSAAAAEALAAGPPVSPQRKRARTNLLARLSGAVAKVRARDATLFAAEAAALTGAETTPLAALSPQQPPPPSAAAQFLNESPPTPTLFRHSQTEYFPAEDLPASATALPPLRLSHSTGDLRFPPVSDETTAAAAPPAKIYDFRLISVRWSDPQLPEVLRPVVESNERLLKLCESGLPTWATFAPSVGFYYRPWLRTLTWVLFYAISFFSLAAGFYDLYKTLPGLQAVLSRAVAGLWLPPVAVLNWIETHAQIRLSLLLTYIFGQSELFLYVVRLLGTAKRTLAEVAGPLISTLTPLVGTALAPLAALTRACRDFGSTLLLPVYMPLAWVAGAVRQAFAAGQGVAGAAAAAGGAGALPWGSSLGFSFSFLPADAVDVLRNSLGRAARAARGVWQFFSHMASGYSRHRITWARRVRRTRRRAAISIKAALWVPVNWLVVVWSFLSSAVAAISSLPGGRRPPQSSAAGVKEGTSDGGPLKYEMRPQAQKNDDDDKRD